MNEKFQNALNRRIQNVPPIWLMRQAGRYHQHYQNLKSKYSFMELCKNPELAAQVALGPIQDFDFDVSILFSDLLFPLEALGMGLTYDPGPKLGWHLTEASFKNLKSIDDALPQLQFQKEAVRCTRDLLPKSKSLIGFVGGPWTLFSYAVQGGHDGSLIEAKTQPHLFSRFCELMVPLLKANIDLQLQGGAEVIMVFDTAAGELSPSMYQELVIPQLAKLAESFPKKLGYYSKMTSTAHLDHPLNKSGLWAGLGVDHRWNLREAFEISDTGFVQGNFDQALLFGDTDGFKANLKKFINQVSLIPIEKRAGWVCGLGHGVLPQTPEKHVRLFVDTLRESLA